MKKWLIGVTATVLFGAVAFYALSFPRTTEQPVSKVAAVEPIKKSTPLSVNRLLELVNEERAKAGVPELKLDTRINASAKLKAKDMLQNDYFGHNNPETGKRGFSYIWEQGVECEYYSENIIKTNGVDTSESAVEGWMSSPSHRAAILDERFELTGFGIAEDYAVQHFCTV